MSELQALIFDVDGTIADTEKNGHRVAFNLAFAEAGLNWNWSDSLYGDLLAISGGKERIRFYLDQYQPNFQPSTNLEEMIATLHASKNHYYKQLLEKSAVPLRLGIRRLLVEARSQGMRLAIATTSAYPNVIALLEQTLGSEALDWFEIIAAGDIVPAKKPAPDIYNYVLENMGLEAQNCLAFEDSHHGLQAALQAGIQTIVTVNDYTREQDFSGALLVLDSLGEPDQPFTVLAGDAGEASYLDLKLIVK